MNFFDHNLSIVHCSSKRPCPFPSGDNNGITGTRVQFKKKKSSSAPQDQFQPNFAQSFLINTEPHPFPRGDNKEVSKIHGN